MPKASTSGAALQKIANALDALRNEYSTKEYRKFDGSSTLTSIRRRVGRKFQLY